VEVYPASDGALDRAVMDEVWLGILAEREGVPLPDSAAGLVLGLDPGALSQEGRLAAIAVAERVVAAVTAAQARCADLAAQRAAIIAARASLEARVAEGRRVARDEPEMFRVMVLFPPELGPADVPDDAELPAATAAFSLAAGAVEEASAGGAIATDDVLLTTLTFFAAAHGVATVLGLGFGLPPELEDQMIDEMLDRLIAGYRTPVVTSRGL